MNDFGGHFEFKTRHVIVRIRHAFSPACIYNKTSSSQGERNLGTRSMMLPTIKDATDRLRNVNLPQRRQSYPWLRRRASWIPSLCKQNSPYISTLKFNVEM